MAEELGKIEKPSVDSFKKGRKLFFVPLVFSGPETPEDYVNKFNRYWEQVAGQIDELAAKLGSVNRVYHELVAEAGEAGGKAISELNEKSYGIVRTYLEKKAQLEALEESDVLMELPRFTRLTLRPEKRGTNLSPAGLMRP
jgi:hypothetical protein